MAFDVLEHSHTFLELLLPIEQRIRTRRKRLAEQIGNASESITLNISEGRQRAGLDRIDHYRRALGSATEVTDALRIAKGRGYVTADEYAKLDAVLDRVRAILWRLTH